MTSTDEVDRVWVATEFVKVIDRERSILTVAKGRAEAPPAPILAVLYHEIAENDQRHVGVLEIIATRYGHTPKRGEGTGVGETLGRLRDTVTNLGTSFLELLSQDVASKAEAIQWETAWQQTFKAIGDEESGRELELILTEDMKHKEALQEALNRMVEKGARGVKEG